MFDYLIDSHCHLDFPELAEDRASVVARAEHAKVRGMLSISTRLSHFPPILTLATQTPQVWCSVGVHPLHVHEEPLPTSDELLALTEHPKVIGIGETGLDYHYRSDTKDLQQASFITHCGVARATQLPLIIHARDADDDIATVLEQEHARGAFPILMHCYSSGEALAKRMLALGAYFSFSGMITFPKAENVRSIAKIVPLDKLLVETDAPYLAPVPYRGKRNEPAFVVHTAQALAALHQLPFSAIIHQTTTNFYTLFTKAHKIA